jgi:hypothetical protein
MKSPEARRVQRRSAPSSTPQRPLAGQYDWCQTMAHAGIDQCRSRSAGEESACETEEYGRPRSVQMENRSTRWCRLLRRRRSVRTVQTRRRSEVSEPRPTRSAVDGGYAEVMIAEARGLARIPDELNSAEAAPLLCAGITTYKALCNASLAAEIWWVCKAWAAWASWHPVCGAHGIPYCRNRTWTRKGKACERFGRAPLH